PDHPRGKQDRGLSVCGAVCVVNRNAVDMLKVLVVDDEPPARARLAQLLSDCAAQLPLTQVGQADGGVAALAAVARLQPDVVLLDISMPDMSGIEVARHLARMAAPPAIIFVTAFDDHALKA